MARVLDARDNHRVRQSAVMTEHHLSTTRTARYAQLGDTRLALSEVWLVCHGYAQLASRFLSRFGALDDGSRLLVAPEALSRFYVGGGSGPHTRDHKVGASWLTHEDRDAEIADQVAYLDAVCERVFSEVDRSAVKLVVLGFSQGASVASRWTVHGSVRPDALLLWGAGLPRDVIAGGGARLGGVPITIVAGARDPLADPVRAAEHFAELDGSGIRYSILKYDGGHEIDEVALREVARSIGAG